MTITNQVPKREKVIIKDNVLLIGKSYDSRRNSWSLFGFTKSKNEKTTNMPITLYSEKNSKLNESISKLKKGDVIAGSFELWRMQHPKVELSPKPRIFAYIKSIYLVEAIVERDFSDVDYSDFFVDEVEND